MANENVKKLVGLINQAKQKAPQEGQAQPAAQGNQVDDVKAKLQGIIDDPNEDNTIQDVSLETDTLSGVNLLIIAALEKITAEHAMMKQAMVKLIQAQGGQVPQQQPAAPQAQPTQQPPVAQ
jgi:hypothetical protein